MKALFKSASSAGAHRPKTAQPSIRGRISGPIPMTTDEDDFPIRKPGTAYASSPPDEEFPIRQPGAARVASIVPIDALDFKEGQPEEIQQPELSNAGAVSGVQGDVRQSKAPEHPSNPPPPRPSGTSPSSGMGGSESSPTHRRTNPSSTLRYSQISAASTGHTGQGGTGGPQRKKSTLRGALSKLFGRRKKTTSQTSADTGRTSGLITTQQHRSDPSALSRVKDNEPKRSASLPITEYSRALRSHSIGPDDITAIESARNSLQAETSAGRRRAATVSSRLYSQSRKGEAGEWSGLSPRPASAHGRGSRLLSAAGDDDADDPSQIGRAITSDSFGAEFTHRRRSRSLSGLEDVAGNKRQDRRRSDEIRYWRESYDQGFLSPLSSGNDDGMDAGDYDDTGAVSLSLPESPAVDRPPKTPPQPFFFGSMAHMSQMAGMKITQAASIETRIGALESHLHKLERVVDQLCHAVPGFKGPLLDKSPADQIPRSVPSIAEQQGFMYTSAAPPMIPAIYQAISADLKGGVGGSASSRYSSSRHSVETDAHSHMSFGDGQTFIGSLHPPSSSATQSQSIPAVASPSNRPTSTSTVTVRGATSLPAIGSAGRSTEEPDLVAQLEAERASRQALEAQVKKLSERLNSLSTTMFAMIRDPKKSRSHERLTPGGTPPLPPSIIGTPPKTTISLGIPTPTKSRSVFEEDSDIEAEKKLPLYKEAPAGPHPLSEEEVAAYDTASEVYQTPGEEKPLYGAFGEELKPDDEDETQDGDPKRKKAARTLSLSQLTMGKETMI